MDLNSQKNSVSSASALKCKLYSLILLLSGFACFSTQVYAEELTVGIKLVYFEMDIPGVDDPDNVGLVVGYDWEQDFGSLGVEGEFTSTFLEGTIANADVELDTAAVYGTFRNQWRSRTGIGPYIKAKAGIVYSDLTLGSEKQDDLNFSVGVGVGLNMVAVSFELEYTIIDDKIDMINLLFRF